MYVHLFQLLSLRLLLEYHFPTLFKQIVFLCVADNLYFEIFYNNLFFYFHEISVIYLLKILPELLHDIFSFLWSDANV